MCALRYKHMRNILPADAEITLKWATNAGLPEFLTDEVKAFIAGLTEKPTLVRNGKDLSDQFDYRPLSASAYFIKFRQSLFAAGVVMSKPGAGVEEGPDLGWAVSAGPGSNICCRSRWCSVSGLQI